MRTLYDLLDVRSDADDEALSKAYRKAAKAHHPDLNAGDLDAPRRFKQIATAIEILRNPEQRAAYDRWLDRERQQRRLRQARIAMVIANAIAAAVLIVVLTRGQAPVWPISTSAMVSEVEDEDGVVPGPVAEAREQRTQRTEPTGGDEPSGEIERVVAVSALSKLLAEAEREAALAREQEGRRQAAEREATPGREQEERGQVAEHERQKVERRAAPRREQGRQEHNAKPLAAAAEAASPATPPSQPVQGAQTASSAASSRSLGPVEIAATRAFTRF